MLEQTRIAALGIVVGLYASAALPVTGNAERGAELYPRACAACHSLASDEHRTGPSLAGIWERKAGVATGFPRYSPALTKADIVWNDTTLDAWLKNPAGFIPGNGMTFPGIDDAQIRADLIAYLQVASAVKHDDASADTSAMPMGGTLPDLKALPPSQQVKAIRYCADSYWVTTRTGKIRAIWEVNLRFKTDSGPLGPVKGTPALMGAGMMGDRFSVIFSDPAEISAFIQSECKP